jgi:transcriptional regulator with XRE-family HTH domain
MKNPFIRSVRSPLGDLRVAANLTQEEAIRKISEVSGGAVKSRRPTIATVERKGTRDLALLQGMAKVYGVSMARVLVANEETKKLEVTAA